MSSPKPYDDIDFEILLYEDRLGPTGGDLRTIICPFCEWRRDVEVSRCQPDGSPNVARKKMHSHWAECEKFPK
jgi:hypothetical protein